MTYVEPYCITRHRKLIQWDVALKHELGHLPINNCGWKCWGDVSCCQTGRTNLQWSICWTAAGWLCVLLLWCLLPESQHNSWTLLFPRSSLFHLFFFSFCPWFLSCILFWPPNFPLLFLLCLLLPLVCPFLISLYHGVFSLFFLPLLRQLNREKYSYSRIKLTSSITSCEDFGYFGYLFPFANICLCTFWM